MPFYIKYDVTDVVTNPPGTAVRPVPYPPGHWNSTSVWFTKGTAPTVTQPSPRVGEACFIVVRVDPNAPGNPPKVPAEITVQAWVCDWTTGAPGPAGVPPGGSTLGVSGEGLEFSGLYDTAPVSNGRIARIPWTPTMADFQNIGPDGSAHMCVGANAFLDVGAPEGARVTSGRLDPLNEPHHAQRNIQILPKTSGGGGMKFMIALVNDGEDDARFVVTAQPARGRLGQLERELLLAQPFIRRVGGRPFDPQKVLGDGDGVPGAPMERFELERGGELALALDDTPLHVPEAGLGRLALGTDEPSGEQVERELPPSRSVDDLRFVTLEAEFADPRDAGGLTVVDVVQADARGAEVGRTRAVLVNVRAEDLAVGEQATAA